MRRNPLKFANNTFSTDDVVVCVVIVFGWNRQALGKMLRKKSEEKKRRVKNET
jgi:hypothetical protein